MSTGLRKEIAYWFFLLLGIAGALFFTYEFAKTDNYTLWEWIAIVSAFSVFIFKPTVLLDVFETLKGMLPSKKT